MIYPVSPLASGSPAYIPSPFRWGRVGVGVDKTNLIPLPFLPSHERGGEIFGGMYLKEKVVVLNFLKVMDIFFGMNELF